MEIAVGCPVWRREWVLGAWFDHVEAAFDQAEVEPVYVFTLDRRDQPSGDVIEQRCAASGRPCHVVITDEDQDQFREDKRDWSQPRIHHMVWVRNKLLGRVRQVAPTLFLSLDSDILLAPTTMSELLEDVAKYDAVGAKCFMTTSGNLYPSNGNLVNTSMLLREDTNVVISTEVIMAAKLMTPSAYRIDYRFHQLGEDIGWSLSCGTYGLALGWDGRSTNKHVMTREDLSKTDVRCGF